MLPRIPSPLMLPLDDLTCDVLILGPSGAGMLAALHVATANVCS